MCIYTGVLWLKCGGQRTTSRNWFSPSTMRILGVELRWSGLVRSASAC